MVREKKATEFEDLPSHIKTKFLERSIFNDAGLSEELDRRGWGAGQGENDLNVPVYMRKLIYYTDDYRPIWTAEMFKSGLAILSDAKRDNEEISPTVYPNAAGDILRAISQYTLSAKLVCTVGSISPWVETILLYAKAKVDVIDYNPPVLQDVSQANLQVVTTPTKKYNAIVSFSSIEHSGLGRYGDDIDPDADLTTMDFFYDILEPDGLLFLAVPLGEANRLEWNHHRIYGIKRYKKLIRRFHVINIFGNQKTNILDKYFHGENNWQNQPVVVLRKR